MRHLFLAPLILVLASCNSQKKEGSTTTGAINQNAPWLWTDLTSPLTIQISDAFDANEVSNIQEMSNAWKTAVDDKKTFFEYGADTPELCDSVASADELRFDSIYGVYKCENTWDHTIPTSALAVTQISARRHNIGTANEYVAIEHADIIVNYRYHSFDTTDSGPNYDLRTVLLHEFGHFIGLTHKSQDSNRNASVMYPSIRSSEAKREPTSIDISDIASKYDIDMGGTGGASMTTDKPAYKPDPNNPGEAVRIIVELHADGSCVHKINGASVKSH